MWSDKALDKQTIWFDLDYVYYMPAVYSIEKATYDVLSKLSGRERQGLIFCTLFRRACTSLAKTHKKEDMFQPNANHSHGN